MSELFEIPEHLLTLTADNIFTCTPHNYAKIQDQYRRFPLPNDILFPWLHGVDGRSHQQNLFFRVRRSLVPKYRGIMLIHCNPLVHAKRLIDSVTPLEVLDEQGQFLNKSTMDTSINLRNFENQVRRFATLCDIFLYGERAHEVAPLVAMAQNEFYQERLDQADQITRTAGKRAAAEANLIKYKTIIIQDEFQVFEKEYPELIMYDSDGVAKRTLDFFELEGTRMREMSAASQVTPGVWAGNTQDAPISTNGITPEDTAATFDSNPHQFSICIECHDLGEIPAPSVLMLARETLNELKDGAMPSEIVHLDMYGTGMPATKTDFDTFYARLVQLLMFMEDQVNRHRQILIHCSDGYTESSTLVLSWIMYRLKLSLPEAYLYLQERRSFFVYAADLPVLRRIEQLLKDEPTEPVPKRRRSEAYENMRHLSIEDSSPHSTPCTVVTGQCVQKTQLSPTPEELQEHPWMFSPRFEGSFPSRILPFLYLGNLNHATNAEMLKALHITHVVSVGENAGLQTKGFELLLLDNLYDDGIDAIRERLDTVMQFIDDARQKGTCCLIHCRVGVSRSAAVTICYVMKHLKYTLVQAYLFVRARRLNVIIQPNLKFVYEMLQLEQKETGTISITWPILCKEIHQLNLTYKESSSVTD
ncbi:hypothetical protein RMATCC62417_12840 [Rhizopus microsporus]|nr:hypothetical protein RMATCC62417_12840 [Rhizopus microsporus]